MREIKNENTVEKQSFTNWEHIRFTGTQKTALGNFVPQFGRRRVRNENSPLLSARLMRDTTRSERYPTRRKNGCTGNVYLIKQRQRLLPLLEKLAPQAHYTPHTPPS